MFRSPSFRAGVTALALAGLPLAGAHAESLKSALTAAYAHNPTITSALFAVKVASENIALRKSAVLPTVGATASLGDTFALTPNQPIVNQPSARLGLD